MASSCAVYPASPSHFTRSPNSSFCGGGWADTTTDIRASGASQASSNTSSPRRPKLSLTTTCSLSLGRGSGPRLDILSAVSPTVRNTYANTHEDSQHNFQNITNPAPAVNPKTLNQPKLHLDPCFSAEGQIDQCATIHYFSPEHTTAGILPEPATETRALPYNQPSNLRSILANSPLLRRTPTRYPISTLDASSSSAPTPVTLKRKRVCFASQLVEEIKTCTYVAKNSDLRSRTPSPVPCPAAVSLGVDGNTISLSTVTSAITDVSNVVRVDKISRKYKDFEEDDTDTVPQTPVAGRRKRQRDWVWTLGPIDQEDVQDTNQSPSQSSHGEENIQAHVTEKTSVSVTDQILEAFKPVTAFCEAGKDMPSGL